MNSSIFQDKRENIDLKDCYFYHSMNLPAYGFIEGEWDLRSNLRKYLGGVIFSQDTTVLDVGSASGYIAFQIERMGANVVAYDLSHKENWDIVPHHNINLEENIINRKNHIKKINNSFWLAHQEYNSNIKMSYGSIYDINKEIGRFDVAILGSILLHLRDPFFALQSVSKHIKKTIIITDIVRKYRGKLTSFIELFPSINVMRFLPQPDKINQIDTWWELSPKLVQSFIKILGFTKIKTTYHYQLYKGKKIKLYTVVGHR